MAAPSLSGPLVFEKGADFAWSWQWQTARVDANGNFLYDDVGKPLGDPKDLSGYVSVEAKMQVRETIDSPVVLVDLTSQPGGGIVIDEPTGRFSVSVESEVIDSWEWTEGEFDFFVVLDDQEVKVIGRTPVVVEPAVTRG